LQELQQARDQMADALAGLPEDAYLRPGVVGFWSVKDIIAHLTVWYSELITALAFIDNPKRVPHIVEIEDIDDYNDQQYRENARRPLAAILEDYRGVHKHLPLAIEGIDENTLTDPRRFRWMEGEPLWFLIAENGYWHEREHADQIRQWRAANGL
jgi:hypothetical protein